MSLEHADIRQAERYGCCGEQRLPLSGAAFVNASIRVDFDEDDEVYTEAEAAEHALAVLSDTCGIIGEVLSSEIDEIQTDRSQS